MKDSDTHRKATTLPGVHRSLGIVHFTVPPLTTMQQQTILEALHLDATAPGTRAFFSTIELRRRLYALSLADPQPSQTRRQLEQIQAQAARAKVHVARLAVSLDTLSSAGWSELAAAMVLDFRELDPKGLAQRIGFFAIAAGTAAENLPRAHRGQPTADPRDGVVADLVVSYKRDLDRDALTDYPDGFKTVIDMLLNEVLVIEGLPNRPALLSKRKPKDDPVLRGYQWAQRLYPQLWR